MHLCRQGVLTYKVSNSLERWLLDSVSAEKKLLEREYLIKQNPEQYQTQRVRFIPDHLGFGCTEGVWVYQVTSPPFESFFVIRGDPCDM